MKRAFIIENVDIDGSKPNGEGMQKVFLGFKNSSGGQFCLKAFQIRSNESEKILKEYII